MPVGPGMGSAEFVERSIKYAIASLIVIAPVYFAVVNILHLNYKKQTLNHNSGINRWLTYLMLLVSALAIVGSLIALISGFLNGDYTSNVLLKILTIMVIAGFVFGYYFYDLKRSDYSKIDQISQAVGIIVIVISLALLVIGLLNVETPTKSRMRAADSVTQQTLSTLLYTISGLYKTNGRLEEQVNLSEYVYGNPGLSVEGISYRKVSDKEFELCANFNLDPISAAGYSAGIPWSNYKQGHQCYTIDAEQENKKLYGTVPPEAEAISDKIVPIPAPAAGQRVN